MKHVFRNATEALPVLLHKVLHQGEETASRNGTTRELTMQQITLTEPQAVITTPGRRVSLPAQIAETMWLLSGRNDIAWLSHYLPRAADFSDDGVTWRGGYGPRLRQWLTLDGEVDQLAHVVRLLKEDPTTRRAVLAIYDPAIDTEPGKDIPCNNWVHLLPRSGALDAHIAIRSNDLFWGWSGINAFEWTSLLQVVAGLTGLQVGSITFSISSLHLYERHYHRAQEIVNRVREHGTPERLHGPAFAWAGDGMEDFDALLQRWFAVEGKIRRNAPDTMRSILDFPEPMMRSWLHVLQAWNTGDMAHAGHLTGTDLFYALDHSPKRKVQEEIKDYPAAPPQVNRAAFTVFATKLHAEKNAAYGDSWKKRGEMLGIMANIARKVDRLGVPGGGDTAADTAIDLMMYLIKYNLWLRQQAGSLDSPTEGKSHVSAVDYHLQRLEQHAPDYEGVDLTGTLRGQFDHLEHLVEEKRSNRNTFVEEMIGHAYALALRLWGQEQDQQRKAEAWHAANATRPWAGYDHTWEAAEVPV